MLPDVRKERGISKRIRKTRDDFYDCYPLDPVILLYQSGLHKYIHLPLEQ